jgi:hypothetical protein
MEKTNCLKGFKMSKSNLFKRYIADEGFLPIYNDPLNRYKINTKGEVIDLKGNLLPIKKDSNGENWVELRVRTCGNILNEYKLANLILHTFKPVNLSPDYHYKLKVLHIDSNYDNVHPSNLVWYWNKLEHRNYPGFMIIPGCTWYAVNEDGDVLNLKNGFKLKQYNYEGYHTCSVVPDIGRTFKARVHRLKALAWIPYSAEVDSLEVNHMDGVKLNNNLSNLEWVTEKENRDHAYISGLNSTNWLKVLSRDIFIDRKGIIQYGDIKTFDSCYEAGRYFKVSGETISRRVKKGQELYCDFDRYPVTLDYLHGVQFKQNDETRWEEVSLEDDPFLNSQIYKPLITRNVLTDKELVHLNPKEAALFLKTKPENIRFLLTKASKAFIYLHNVKYIDDRTEWPKYSDDQIEVFKVMNLLNNYPSQGYGYKCTNSVTNEIRYFVNSSGVASFLNITKFGVNKKILFKRKEKDWVIEAINMSTVENMLDIS